MIIHKIAHAISPYRKLLVGFSGGLDSTVLLHRLKLWRDQEEENISLRAVHVHHGLSPFADSWVEHCISQCHKWEITLTVVYAKVVKTKLGIEAQARKVRYAAFQKMLLPGEALVIAQHLNDQCETFLLALKRGSGPAGLSAMRGRTNFFNTQLLRPFLNEKRESLRMWAKVHSLRWIEDESNQDDRYDRNFLRLHVVRLLTERWPYISTSISRSADLCAEQEELLNELLDKELEKLISVEGAIEISPLTKMNTIHRSALLRRWIAKQKGLMPSRSMLNRIWLEVAQARKDAYPCIYLNGYEVRRFKGFLWRIKPRRICNDTVIIWNNLDEPLMLPYGIGKVCLKSGGNIILPSKKNIVSVRFKASGIIHIFGRYGGRKLQKIWQELNIPPWERKRIPLLFYDDSLIAAAGKFIIQSKWVEHGGVRFEIEM